MALTLEVVGSAVRDFCMLERNFLAHVKLVLLLILLSSSALLGIRLPGPTSQQNLRSEASLSLAILTLVAAVVTIAAAIWEYHTSVKNLLRVRAFLIVTKLHYAMMAVVSAIVIATCGVYIAYSS